MAGPDAVVVTIGRPVSCDDLPGLCARVRRLVEDSNAELVVCDVGRLVQADLATVGGIARLALTAQRSGASLLLRGVSRELRELLVFSGLGTSSGALAFDPDTGARGSGAETR